MRKLRIFALIVLIGSLAFSLWANNRYYSNKNMDMPTITDSLGALDISVQGYPDAMFQGLTAKDKTDGDLTDQIMVASMSHFLEPGTVSVKYVVFDQHNNSATLTRKVHFTDYVAPQFSLDKAPVYMTGSAFDLLDHIQVTDCIDGDISDHIRVISNTVYSNSVGTYPIVLETYNSSGDTSRITLWVTYQTKESGAVVNLSQYIVYVEQGDTTFNPQEMVASVTDRTGVALDAENIEIQGYLDHNTPGSYQLVYSYDDGKLNGESPLTVVVTERQG